MVVQAVAVKAGTHVAKKAGSKVVRKASTRTAGRAGTRTAGSRAAGRTSTGTATRARTRRVGRTNTRRVGTVQRVNSERLIVNSDQIQEAFKRQVRTLWSKTETEMESAFEEQGEELSEEVKDEIINEGEEQTVVFPVFILAVALIKDTVFDVAQLTIVGAILTFFGTILANIIIFFWLIGKMRGARWKRQMLVKVWIWFFGVTTIESLPILSLIPATTILVFLAANREKKFAQMFNEALEAFSGSGLQGHVKR